MNRDLLSSVSYKYELYLPTVLVSALLCFVAFWSYPENKERFGIKLTNSLETSIGLIANFLIFCIALFILKELIVYFFNLKINFKGISLLVTIFIYASVYSIDKYVPKKSNPIAPFQMDLMTILNLPGLFVVQSVAELVRVA